MVANFDRSTKKLLNSSKSNPCPVCGRTKDGDCRISRDGKMVLCHQNFDHTKTNQPDVWHFDGTSSDNRCGVYVFKEPTTKSIRPKQTRYWEYPARDGSPLVRVGRSDNGKGKKTMWQERWDKDAKKWVKGLGSEGDPNRVNRADIPIYRYAEIQEAKARGEEIFKVEGETCADLLWKLGMAATTNIGGCENFTESDARDLEGVKVLVISPDRDIKGVRHADEIEEYFPNALWLYPFPNSQDWNNLPEKNGLDLVDWVENEKLSASDILAAIGEKKVLQASNSAKPDLLGSNVITHARFTPPNSAELREELTKLIKAGTAGSELTEAIFGLAKGGNPQPIWHLYKEISEEVERADQRADRKRDVENLLTIGNRRLTLENYLHPHLAEPIKKVSTWMGVDPEAVLTHLLPIAAGLINPNSRVVAKRCINFVQPLLLYTGVVALTGARKTPTLDIVKQPLVKLQSAEDALHEQALQRYEAELQALKKTTNSKGNGGGEFPQKPKPVREFYLDNATVESVDKVKCQQPDNGLTLIKDELSGLFASHGAYKGGKGADKESYLSGWNGGGVKKNRAGDGSRVSLARDSLSITGGIQPDKLRELLGDFSDSQGEWARFLFYSMPMRPFKIPRDDTSYCLDGLLADIYEKIDALPVLKLHFEKLGQTYFDDWHDEKDEQKLAETRPGLQAAIAKMPGQAVRLIGLLHILWEVASGSAEVPEEIPQAIVKSGCKLADFYLDQVTILQGDGDVENGELAPTLRKLLDKVADLKTLTASQARRAIRDLRKTDANKVRQLFVELKMMGLAETQGKGSQLALVSKELTNSEELQKQHKPYSVDVLEDSSLKELTTVDKKLTNNQWSQTNAESGLQDTKSPTVDKVDTFETLDSNTPPQTAELIDIPDLSDENPKMIKDVVNLSTIGTENLSQCEIEEVDTPSTICVNSSENVNSSPEESIAPPEPVTAPTEPKSSEIEPEMGVADEIFEAIKEAIATLDRAAARFAWQKIKNSPTQKEAVKAKLTEEEVLNLKILVATGWFKGMRVKYVGTKFESLAGVELTIDKIDGNGITCTKPDGSYITDLDKEDLVKLEQSEGGA
jgi:CRISPR-associated protein Cmr3